MSQPRRSWEPSELDMAIYFLGEALSYTADKTLREELERMVERFDAARKQKATAKPKPTE